MRTIARWQQLSVQQKAKQKTGNNRVRRVWCRIIKMELSQPKTSFKRFELPVQRFSKTALPLYLDLLKKHEQNIVKVRRLCLTRS